MSVGACTLKGGNGVIFLSLCVCGCMHAEAESKKCEIGVNIPDRHNAAHGHAE